MRVVVGDIQVERSVLPEDPMQATDATVHKVVEIAMGRYGARSAKIRALAINLMNDAGVADKDYFGMAQAIHNWVRDQIRYVKDPVNQETLSHPEETAFNSLAGDCDDKTTLEIALLASVGIQAWPVVIGTSPAAYSHIYLMVLIPQGSPRAGVYPADPIMREWAFGREAPASVIKLRKEYPQLVGVSMRGIGAYMVGPAYLDETKTAQASIDARAARRAAGADSWDINAEVHPTNDGADGLFMAQPATAVEITRLGPITAFDAQQATRPLRGPKTVTVRADMHTTGDQREDSLQGLGMAPPSSNTWVDRVKARFGTRCDRNYDPGLDLNNDGSINAADLSLAAQRDGQQNQPAVGDGGAAKAAAAKAAAAQQQRAQQISQLQMQLQQMTTPMMVAQRSRNMAQMAMLRQRAQMIQMQIAQLSSLKGLGAAPTGDQREDSLQGLGMAPDPRLVQLEQQIAVAEERARECAQAPAILAELRRQAEIERQKGQRPTENGFTPTQSQAAQAQAAAAAQQAEILRQKQGDRARQIQQLRRSLEIRPAVGVSAATAAAQQAEIERQKGQRPTKNGFTPTQSQAAQAQAAAAAQQAEILRQKQGDRARQIQQLQQQLQMIPPAIMQAHQSRNMPQVMMLQQRANMIQAQIAQLMRAPLNGLGAAPSGEADVQDLYSRIPQAQGPTAQSQVLWLRHLAPLVQARYAPKLRAALGPIPREPAAAVQKAMVEIDEMVRNGTPPANAIATVIDAKVRADQAPTDKETGAPSYEFGPNSVRKTSNRIW